MDVLVQLRAGRERLSEAERRVAQRVLADPEAVVHLSVQALAEACDVSVATVIRLTRRLGCSGYAEFKIELARQQQGPGISAIYEAVEENDSAADVVSKVFGGNSRSLDDTLAMLEIEQLEKVARRIARCRRCLIYGFGSSGYMAQDTALRFGHLGIDALAYPGTLETAISAMRATRRDVAIGISHSGRTATTVDSLAAAGEQGAITVGISNYKPSPLSEVSDVFFCLSFPESRVRAAALSSRASQVCLIDALYLLAARQIKAPRSTDDVDEMVETRFRLPARARGKAGKDTTA